MTQEKRHIVSTIFLIIFLALTLLSFIFLPILFSLILFIFIFFPILLYIILVKLTHRWIICLFVSFFIYVIVIAGLGFWIYSDAMSLSNNAQSQPIYVLYKDGNSIPLAINARDLNFSSGSKVPVLAQADIKKIWDSKDEKDKFVIIINKEFFDVTPENLDFEVQGANISMTKAEAFNIITSADPTNILIMKMANSGGLTDLPPQILEQVKQGNIPDELKQQIMQQGSFDIPTLKVMVFGLLIMKTIQVQGLDYVFESAANGRIVVKPFYVSVWIIEHIPLEIVKPLLPSDLQTTINQAGNDIKF